MDKDLVTGMVFVDLHKAFDIVDVNIVLVQLANFGICRNNFSGFRVTLLEDPNMGVWVAISLTHHH